MGRHHMSDSLIIRNADLNDIDAVMRVERDWPKDQRASRDKFVSRLEIFPEGFFLAEVNGEIAGVSTSTLATYSPDKLALFRSWEQCTNNGYYNPLKPMEDYNALYIVSNGIRIPYRGTQVREALITAHLDLAKTLGLTYTVTGAMLPGYAQYCKQNGEITAHDYAFLTEDGKPLDPTIRKLASLGLHLPDKRHIIDNFYQSPESRDYGALLVHKTYGSFA